MITREVNIPTQKVRSLDCMCVISRAYEPKVAVRIALSIRTFLK